MPTLTLVAALARNRVIGAGNSLPWRLPADMRHFKRITMGKPVVMGRKTYLSIGRALPGRTNIVLTRDPSFQAPGCLVARSLDQALSLAGEAAEVCVLGGGEIFALALPRARRQELTLIHQEFAGDCLYPALDPGQWRVAWHERHEPDDENPVPYTFLTLERTNCL